MGCPTACVQTCLMQHGVERISCGSNTTLFTFCIRLGNYLKKKIIITKKNARSPEQFKGPKKIKKKNKLKKICFKRAKFWQCKAPAALRVHSQLYLPFPTTCPAIPMAAEHRTNTPFNKDFSNFFDLGRFSPTQNKNNPSDFLAKSGPHEDSCFEARRTAPILLC